MVDATMTDDGFNATVDCPDFDESGNQLLHNLGYWMEGIAQCSIAVLGIMFNIGSSLVLASRDMRNSFNLLLIALSLFDTCYLVGSILESMRKSFEVHSEWHTLLFPYVLYPGHMIAMTGSVFMTVAIAMERYVAVHYPLDYNQSMNDENASLRRVLKYVVPVILFSVVFNLPKFFEGQIAWNHDSDPPTPEIQVTELRLNRDYMLYYNNILRLVVLGILPFVMLVFFNTKIYSDVKARRRRRCPPRPPSISLSAEAVAKHVVTNGNGNNDSNGSANGDIGANIDESPVDNADATTHLTLTASPSPESEHNQLTVPEVKVRASSLDSTATEGSRKLNKRASRLTSTLTKSKRRRNQRSFQVHSRSDRNANRRRLEDNLAVIFMAIVLFFLISHFPRIILGLQELLEPPHPIQCHKAGKRTWALWVLVFSHVSHLMLVLNCCTNSVIYCGMSSKFRNQVVMHFKPLQRKAGIRRQSSRMVTYNNNPDGNDVDGAGRSTGERDSYRQSRKTVRMAVQALEMNDSIVPPPPPPLEDINVQRQQLQNGAVGAETEDRRGMRSAITQTRV